MSKKVQELATNARICLDMSDYIDDAENKAEALSKASVVLSTADSPDLDDAETDGYSAPKKKR